MWFEQLFGRRERDWDTTQAMFTVDGTELVAPNGRRFGIGRFSTPDVAALRTRATAAGLPGDVRVAHEVIGDALEIHASPENRGALFQVASQFNCLEFPGPETTPESGVTGYAGDPTQGPACSLAAAAATVYRNYFAPVDGHAGQRRDRQLDNLAGLTAALGAPGDYYTVRNGYTDSDPARLAAFAEAIAERDRDALVDTIRIGLHTAVEVTFASRWRPPTAPTHVSQAFCSAISCGYVHGVTPQSWEPLATLVLDAAYEATLWAAILDAAEGSGSGRVWLTFVGGGVFANQADWIVGAINRALAQVHGFALDVRIAHFRRMHDGFRLAIR